MNKTFKLGLGMLAFEFGIGILILLGLIFASINWTTGILLISGFVGYNVLSLILLIFGLLKSN